MKKKQCWCILIAFVLVCTLGLSGCANGEEPAQNGGEEGQSTDPIVIGTLLPKSGAAAVFGEAAWQGFEIARRMINEDGGINGRTVEFADADAPDPTAAATEAERLISQEKVKIIMGSIASGNSLAASALAERNGVIYWETTAITDEVTDNGYKHVFRVVDKSSYRGIAAVRALAEDIAPMIGKAPEELKLAIATEDSAYGQVQADAAEAEADKLGMQVVAKESYPATSTDLSACILKLKNANADVLFAVGYINDTNLFWNQARQYGLKFQAVVGGGSGYTDLTFPETQGEHAEGIMDVDTPSGIPVEMFQDEQVKKDVERFRTMYKEAFNVDKVHFASEIAWSGAWILLNSVLPTAGSDDPEAIIEAAMGLDIQETVLGYGCKFDENHQNEKAISGLYQWVDGVATLVIPREYSTIEITGIPLPNNY